MFAKKKLKRNLPLLVNVETRGACGLWTAVIPTEILYGKPNKHMQ